MVEFKKSELKNLPPKERLKRLRQIEEERKKEIEEAEKLIKESLREIKQQEVTENVEIPEEEEIDITRLFKEEEESLGAIVEKEKEEKETELDFDYIGTVQKEAENFNYQALNMQNPMQLNQREFNVKEYASPGRDIASQLFGSKTLESVKRYARLGGK